MEPRFLSRPTAGQPSSSGINLIEPYNPTTPTSEQLLSPGTNSMDLHTPGSAARTEQPYILRSHPMEPHTPNTPTLEQPSSSHKNAIEPHTPTTPARGQFSSLQSGPTEFLHRSSGSPVSSSKNTSDQGRIVSEYYRPKSKDEESILRSPPPGYYSTIIYSRISIARRPDPPLDYAPSRALHVPSRRSTVMSGFKFPQILLKSGVEKNRWKVFAKEIRNHGCLSPAQWLTCVGVGAGFGVVAGSITGGIGILPIALFACH